MPPEINMSLLVSTTAGCVQQLENCGVLHWEIPSSVKVLHWFTSWSGETGSDWPTHTHTHTVWWTDVSCSCIFAKKTELGFKDTTAGNMDHGCGLIPECKISVTWMTIITEPLQSLFIYCQVHLGDDNNSELRKLVMQHWLWDRL